MIAIIIPLKPTVATAIKHYSCTHMVTVGFKGLYCTVHHSVAGMKQQQQQAVSSAERTTTEQWTQ